LPNQAKLHAPAPHCARHSREAPPPPATPAYALWLGASCGLAAGAEIPKGKGPGREQKGRRGAEEGKSGGRRGEWAVGGKGVQSSPIQPDTGRRGCAGSGDWLAGREVCSASDARHRHRHRHRHPCADRSRAPDPTPRPESRRIPATAATPRICIPRRAPS
jgi:hypothetical protein